MLAMTLTRDLARVWHTPADARAAAEAVARRATASGAAHPNVPWDERLDPRLIAGIVEELDPRKHPGRGGRPTTTWQRREQAFYAHLEKLLRPSLYIQVCVVLFDAIEQARLSDDGLVGA